MKIKNLLSKCKGFLTKCKSILSKLKTFFANLWVNHKKHLIIITASATVGICAAVALVIWNHAPAPEEPVLPEDTCSVGVCIPEGSTLDTEGLANLLRESGYKSTVYDQFTDQSQLLQQIDQIIAESFNLIIIQVSEDTAITDLLNQPQQAGVPVIFIDYKGTTPENCEGVTFISQDPTAPGLFQAELVNRLPNGGDINGDGVVSYSILTGPADNSEVQLQLSGIRKLLGNQELISTRNLEFSQQIGFEHCTDLLATYGKDLEVIICGNEDLSLGASSAITSAGRIVGGNINLIANGSSQEILDQIAAGLISSTVAQDNAAYANRIAQIADTILSGEPYDRQYYTNHYMVTGFHYSQ